MTQSKSSIKKEVTELIEMVDNRKYVKAKVLLLVDKQVESVIKDLEIHAAEKLTKRAMLDLLEAYLSLSQAGTLEEQISRVETARVSIHNHA